MKNFGSSTEMRRVWFVMTECRAIPGADFPGSSNARIVVECYVPASTIREAIGAAEDALRKEHFEVVDFSRCTRFDLDDWDDDVYPPDSTARFICERVVESGVTEFGPFCYSE